MDFALSEEQRLLITTAQVLASRKDAVERYLAAYRETVAI